MIVMGKDALESKVNEWMERGFLALSSLVLMYCAAQIRDLNHSVAELNTKLTIYITKQDNQTHILTDHEKRLRALELPRR